MLNQEAQGEMQTQEDRQCVSPFIGNSLNRQIRGDRKGVNGTEDGRKRMDSDF